MKNDSISGLLAFLAHVKKAKIGHTLDHCRENAIMVRLDVPGERWEVEFLDDGTVEVEIFKSGGKIRDAGALEDLFARFSE